ncbi:MAG TPA: hypothetical protein VGO48_06445 [Conexibacter sp.]|jgi:hypothetical protein|nr:hypothetical protein [Conexibacter sp.]
MSRSRTVVASAALAVLVIAAVAPAAEAPTPRPVVTISAQVSPGQRPIPQGAPLTLRLNTTFESVPAGGNFVLQRATYMFGKGARFNGKLFPSCSAAKLRAAHGRLSACPPGSKIGSGVATGRAVAVGITSSGRMTIFNGPGGRSIVLNFVVINPALINATFQAPIVRVHGGRYAFKLSTSVPPELQRILDGDVVVKRIDITTGATRMIDGRRRGYYEAGSCPKGGGSAIHGEFEFNQGMSAVADQSVVC